MNGFPLDANVIGVLSPSRSEVPAAFLDPFERMDSEGRIFLPAVTAYEIESA